MHHPGKAARQLRNGDRGVHYFEAPVLGQLAVGVGESRQILQRLGIRTACRDALMRNAGVNFQVHHGIRGRKFAQQPRKQAAPRQPLGGTQCQLAVEVPVHHHQALSPAGAQMVYQHVPHPERGLQGVGNAVGQPETQPGAQD
jgi:hypothetical protein